MSRRVKRLVKKMKQVSAFEIDKQVIQNCIAQAEQNIKDANKILEQIKKEEEYFENYVNKAKNSKLLVRNQELNDGVNLEVTVVQEDRTIIVSAFGFVAKAKAHEKDEFDFEVGYNLALKRLMDDLLSFIENKEE
jgi:hypothetical protein